MLLKEQNRMQELNDYWTQPYLSHQEQLSRPDPNNNNVIICPLNESSLLKLSADCLDLNYKSRRQLLAEAKFKTKQEEKKLPILNKFDLLSQVYSLSDFIIRAQLGQGSFGKVYSAYFSKSINRSQKLAIKVIPISKDTTAKNYLKSFQAEQNIKNLKHPNLITQLGCNERDATTLNAFIIYEYGGRMNLSQFIFSSDMCLEIGQRKSFCLDLSRALEFIHSHGIVHMDLKPANVIVTDSLQLKLTDFGCSVKLAHDEEQEYETHRWTAGTWFYRAPELFRADKLDLFQRKESVTTKCDIYSLGILMWQLLTRDSPYHSENPHVIIYQIVTNLRRPEFPVELKQSTTEQTKMVSLAEIQNKFNQLSNLANKENEYLQRKFKLNTEFDRVFRMLIEKSWNDDPQQRLDASQIREIIINTKISYS